MPTLLLKEVLELQMVWVVGMIMVLVVVYFLIHWWITANLK